MYIHCRLGPGRPGSLERGRGTGKKSNRMYKRKADDSLLAFKSIQVLENHTSPFIHLELTIPCGSRDNAA